MKERLCIIGCGNPNRSDDGVGPYVINALLNRQGSADCEHIDLYDAGTDGMQVMFKARGASALILVDACQSGAEPGTLFKVPGNELESEFEEGANLHSFRWQNALYAGRKMYGDDFPDQVSVWLIESQDLGLGLELSEKVKASANDLMARLEEQIVAFQARQP